MIGADHPDTLRTAGDLAGCLFEQNKVAEAEQLLQAALALSQCVLGPGHRVTLSITSSLLEGVQRQHILANDTLTVTQILVAILLSEGRLAEAELFQHDGERGH